MYKMSFDFSNNETFIILAGLYKNCIYQTTEYQKWRLGLSSGFVEGFFWCISWAPNAAVVLLDKFYIFLIIYIYIEHNTVHFSWINACKGWRTKGVNVHRINLLNPMSDQERISPYNINTILRWLIRWSNNKFSQLTL